VPPVDAAKPLPRLARDDAARPPPRPRAMAQSPG
jgi:hypothetical protein